MIPGLPRLLIWLLLGVALWISYHLITQTTTGDLVADLGLGSAILTQLMTGLDAIFLTHPNTLKNLQDPQTSDNKITEKSFSQRLRWTFNLYINPRGIGWAHEPPDLPSRPSPSTSRWNFIGTRITIIILCAAWEFATYVSNASNPGMTTSGRLLSDSAIHWRALGVASFAVAGAARITSMDYALSIIVVGLGWSRPDRWPGLFGSPMEAWTVQRFWRRSWHQLLRKPLLACTQFVVTKIFRRPSIAYKTSSNLCDTANKFIWLYTAFFITGVVHGGGEYMLLRRPGFGALAFFVLQAVGITIEKTVGFAWTLRPKKHNICPKQVQVQKGHNVESPSSEPEMWIRCIGYTWVCIWFVWSLPFMIDPLVLSGMFVDPRFDVRIWDFSLSLLI
ncbi:hypothetical protein GALMADRAFT_223911 [Galerina marginata CBS 339.88]|uniref:Wax synthase domain-containing protein n=1 Tax=Galerina marginata (strain CBS 339.88) TaxID=685588 RepID=A0A067TFG8_GALM3|nr:hypothetical protein GALMADRAFT_223911 [Galerina marginata CBS 339.88]